MSVETKIFEGGGEVKTEHVNLDANAGDAVWATATVIMQPSSATERLAITKLVICPYSTGTNHAIDIGSFTWPGTGGAPVKTYFSTVFCAGIVAPIIMDFSECPIMFGPGECLKAKMFAVGAFTTGITACAIDYKRGKFYPS